MDSWGSIFVWYMLGIYICLAEGPFHVLCVGVNCKERIKW